MARDVFRVRLNCVDHYQSAPSVLDPQLWGPLASSSTQKANLPHVPVIRVFGSTETGQKVCAHVHGALPYLFIPYAGPRDGGELERYMATLRSAIDHALALTYRRNPYDSNPRNNTFVAHVSLVKGVPFFGYTVGFHYYLKIYLLNPAHITRFADLLLQGAIMHQIFQPYEAHLQFLLQWMCDFNLYGCAYVEVEARKLAWRSPVPAFDDLDDPGHYWHDGSIDRRNMLDELRFPRQSHCQLEIDIQVEDILNRREVKPRELHHSFIERLASLENLPPEEKLVHSMAGLWRDETRRRRKRMGITDPSSSPFPPEVLISMSADPRNESKGGWIHEDELREMVEKIAEQEHKARGGTSLSFESFVGPQQEDGIQTVLQSVEEIFQERLASRYGVKDATQSYQPSLDNRCDLQDVPTPPIQSELEQLVDTNTIAGLPDDDDYGSDEDVARVKALTQHQNLTDAGVSGAVGENGVIGDAADLDERADQLDDQSLPESAVHAAARGLFGKRSALTSDHAQSKRVKLETSGLDAARRRHVSFRTGGDLDPSAVQRGGRVPDDEGFDDVSPGPHQPTVSGGGEAQTESERVTFKLPPSSQRSSQSSSQRDGTLDFPTIKYPKEKSLQPQPKSTNRSPSEASPIGGGPKQLARCSTQSQATPSSQSDALISPEQRPTLPAEVAQNIASVFQRLTDAEVFIFGTKAPTCEFVERTVEPHVIYQDAYYSNEKDVPERPREYAGQEFRLESTTLPYLPDFNKYGELAHGKGQVVDKSKYELAEQRRSRGCSLLTWEIMHSPPTYAEVQAWMQNKNGVGTDADDLAAFEVDGPPSASQVKRKNRPAPELSQIDGPTQKHTHGFKFSQKKKVTSVEHETGYMSMMALEVHVNNRAELAPDPERDEICLIVWSIADEQMEDGGTKTGVVVLTKEEDEYADLPEKIRRTVPAGVQIDAEDNELDVLNRMVEIVRTHDPDILIGFEVHNNSWGYLIERARLQYEYNLPDEFSRMKSQSHGRFGKDADRWGFNHTSTVRITGRHTINIWRAMRSELNLLQYTMENVVFHVLHRRIPHYPFSALTRWYKSGKPKDLAKVLDYFITRTHLDLEILDANELIPRTSEQARLLGVDFFSVFSRGSQFKVESLMFRIAKPESFLLVSPSRKQVGGQNALECLPLVMEPQSAFYTSPLLVLDFQSLYPSVMIAYNYCYSTCLGRIVEWRGTNKLGFADFKRAPGLLELVKDKINISPNGMMYVKPEMRKSLLAKMLGEILETRVMVKSGMKVDKDDKTLQQLLNNRQLALKLIANVTYGYTSASFSGRMPCSEIADSIVQTARETLEKAIALIHSVERWNAEVVYGDTDSLFVYLKGRTKSEAFDLGNEIAKAVTNMNPRPVKLKFEKVYHPCVLLAKKRYVGFKYESPAQTEPEFDAKGIETVRRDGTPAEQKIEEKALKLLFRTSDLSQVKAYFQEQCAKIMAGRFSIQDFCFAKEVKLGTYAEKGPPPPGALIATRRMLRDPRTEPQYGERVPYVVIAGAPGARLWERCVEPERLINDERAELDAEYYISKNLIPPLERIFNLVGANVRQWYDEMPKVQRVRMLGGPRDGDTGKGKKTLESYMGSSVCLACRARLFPVPPGQVEQALPLCDACRTRHPQRTLLTLRRKLQKAEKKVADMYAICRSCANLSIDDEIRCDSRDCPVMYSRVKAETQLNFARAGLGKVLEMLEREIVEGGEGWKW